MENMFLFWFVEGYFRIDSGNMIANKSRQRLQIVLANSLRIGDYNSRSTVANTARVSGRYSTALLEDRWQLADVFDLGVLSRMLVNFEQLVSLFTFDGNWRNLVLEVSVLMGFLPALLRNKRVLVGLLTRDLELLGEILSRYRHWQLDVSVRETRPERVLEHKILAELCAESVAAH